MQPPDCTGGEGQSGSGRGEEEEEERRGLSARMGYKRRQQRGERGGGREQAVRGTQAAKQRGVEGTGGAARLCSDPSTRSLIHSIIHSFSGRCLPQGLSVRGGKKA